ncbi:hypothetical protein ACHAWF_009453 [Thalassiosira exigua]
MNAPERLAPAVRRSVAADALLSTLIHAAHLGSRAVASCSESSSSSGPGGGGSRSLNVRYKDPGDARSALTEADVASQRVVVSSLLRAHPGLEVVGEEDETVRPDSSNARELRLDLLDGFEWTVLSEDEAIDQGSGEDEGEEEDPALPTQLQLDELTAYVDPLDGTREFVEGRLGNVQCLVGACHRGRPIMGAVGLPFSNDGSSTGSTEVVFGMVGRGIGTFRIEGGVSANDKDIEEERFVRCDIPSPRSWRAGDPVDVSSGDASGVRPAVDLAERTFSSEGGIRRQVLGATGNKLLRIIRGETTLSLLHNKTSLWDTCAPSALLTAIGGRVTDYNGTPLVYGDEKGNKLGVVASAPGARRLHNRITKALREAEFFV